MEQNVLNTIEELYHQGDFSYVLYNYVDTDSWAEKFTHEIKDIYIHNLTDFNYSKCFTLYIQSSQCPNLEFGTDEFNAYIKENDNIIGLFVYISAVAPYAAITYIKYEYVEEDIKMFEQYEPFDEKTDEIGNRILNYFKNNLIEVLKEDVLEMKVPNVSLELREEDVTVFNCLFEDSY